MTMAISGSMFCGSSGTIGSGAIIGGGSGVLISADGYLLTCAHVVAGVQRIEVILTDRTLLVGRVLGWNDSQDYALLKVQVPRPLPYLPLGSSADVAS